MINFVCWKWKPKPNPWKHFNEYTYEHVNILYSMLKRNMSDPFRLVCLTDDPTGIDPEITILPVWDDFAEYGGCYRRLKLFTSEMRDLIGEQIVSIDLDCVILKDVTPLFRDLPDFKIMKATTKNRYCGALYAIRAGSHPEVWERFDPDRIVFRPNKCHRYKGTPWFGTDQAVIADILLDAPTWHWNDGIYNYREIMVGKSGGRMAMEISRLWREAKLKRGIVPKNARIVFFNGKSDPSDVSLQQIHSWILENWK